MPPAIEIEDASGFRGQAEEYFAPASPEELRGVLRRASETATPLTIAGARTGLAGGCVPRSGWVVSLEKFQHIEIHAGAAIAGAGVALRDLQAAARASRQFYPPDPTETSASIGGTIACNASGSRSFLYGDTRRWVRRIDVAFIDGSIRRFARGDTIDFAVPTLPRPATTKFSAGFLLEPDMDWVDLFVGSEGILGVVYEAELGLLPASGGLLAGVVFFAAEDAALDAVDAWRGLESLRMLEYLDRGSLELLRARFPEIPLAAAAAVLVEQADPSGDEPDRWLERLAEAGAAAEASWFGTTDADRERFRRFRHALPETINDIVRRNGFLKLGSDYAVPLARNREMLAYYRARLDPHFPGRYVIFGHIGDAHVHVNILPASAEEFTFGQELMLDFAAHAVSLGGVVGAEHGLGKRKQHLLALQYTTAQIAAMREVKQRLDPAWLLGRGTLLAH